MTLKIEKGQAHGKISAPASKSMGHRLLICAAACQGESRINGLNSCEDILATIDCLRALGAKIKYDGSTAVIKGTDLTKSKPTEPLNCRESGSTLRFLIPIAMLSGNEVTLVGSERLMARSQSVYERLAEENGIYFERKSDRIILRGPIKGGEYFVNGNVSSQFISGLILALSMTDGDARVIVNTSLESRPYVDMTIAAMRAMGVRVHEEYDCAFFSFGGQSYKAGEYTVEGDWSNAAFLDAFNMLGGNVEICGLTDGTKQGDKIYKQHFAALKKGYSEIDISDCPDLGPILFCMAAVYHGAKFVGTRRLRDKESDRISAMESELKKLGARMHIEENSVTVEGGGLHCPTERLYGHNDHRIVMSLAVMCSMLGGEIEGCEAASKSYPEFFNDIKLLGINCHEIR